ncbi:MAG: AsmA family protein [Gammaproteobacteria bacterium]|nr:AsmA family protein [Gammaproteobacteria bacterium]
MARYLTRALLALSLLGALSVLVLLGLALRGVSLEPARALIESYASEALGVSVQLTGPATLQLGRTTRLSVAGVSMVNTQWPGQQPLLAVETATIAIDTATLLSRPIRIVALAVSGAELNVLRGADGQANWPQLAADTSAGEAAPTEVDAARATVLPLVIERLDLGNIALHYADDANDQRIHIVIDQLRQQQAASGQLELAGSGRLNADPWQISGTVSSPQSLYSGRNLSQQLSGSVGSVVFRSSGEIPDISVLKDMTLAAEINGAVPEGLAAVSPLFERGSQLDARVVVTDVDPGIQLAAQLDFDHFTLKLDGVADDPARLDGLALSIDAVGKSINRVATAFGSAEVPDTPFTLRGKVRRVGPDLALDALHFEAGAHRILLDGDFTRFPQVDGANITVRASGPDFSVWQRAARRPGYLAEPYEFTGELSDREGLIEFASSSLRIGRHGLSFEGLLGQYPEMLGTDIKMALNGPDLAQLGAVLQVSGLPPQPYAAQAKLAVDQSSGLVLRDLQATAQPLLLTGQGTLGNLPALDALNMQINLHSASLRELGEQLEVTGLGDVPLDVTLTLGGEVAAPVLQALELEVAGSTLTARGPLHMAGGGIEGDLDIKAQLQDAAQLLGKHFPQGLSPGPYNVQALQSWQGGLMRLDVRELAGPEFNGVAKAELRDDFSLQDAKLEADVRLEQPSALFAVADGPGLPDTPLRLGIESSVLNDAVRNHITVRGADASTIDLVLTMPVSGDTPMTLHFSGAGDELKSIVGTGYVPEGDLPFELSGELQLHGNTIALDLATLRVGQSIASARLNYEDADVPTLSGELRIERAELDRWLALRPADTAEATDTAPDAGTDATAATKPARPSNNRMIPEVPIETAVLEQYRIDLAIEAGPLGIADPNFSSESLIDHLQMQVAAGDGALAVEVVELRGSRGMLKGKGTLAPDAGELAAAMQVQGVGFPLGITSSAPSIDVLPLHDFQAQFTATGNTTRAMAQTLAGSLRLHGGAGTVENIGLDLAMASFTAQLLDALLPSRTRTTDLQIECTVIALTAAAGVIELSPGLVMRTRGVDLTAHGKVNLANEKLKIRFDNKPRKGLGISAAGLVNPYVQIVGTLSRPSIGLNATSGAIAGGAAVATGGLSILGTTLYDRFLNSRTPCEDALAQFDKAQPGPSP